MTEMRYGELTIICHDDRPRSCPFGLADELERVFNGVDPDETFPRGPTMTFKNGVKVRFFTDEERRGKVLDLAHHKHVVLRGPDPGKAHLPPFIRGNPEEDIFTAPSVSCIYVVDPLIRRLAPSEEMSWIVQWPGFTIPDARRVLDVLMGMLKIQKKIRFRKLKDGFWSFRASGERNAIVLGDGVKVEGSMRLRGSKYPWGELKEGEPCILEKVTSTNLLANFGSWARFRGVKWKIQTRTVVSGIEVTRLPGKTPEMFLRDFKHE